MRGNIANKARSAELATIISYPTRAGAIIVLSKTVKKYCKIIVATIASRGQPEDNLTVVISLAWHNGLYTIAAKSDKSIELHYKRIQF